MDAMFRANLGGRFLFLQQLQHHLGFEGCGVRLFHRVSLPLSGPFKCLNFLSHYSEEMQAYLEGVNFGRSRDMWLVRCVLFAPNAPEQNPIEDVWLKAKDHVRKHWQECDTFQRVTHFFEEAINALSFNFKKLRMYLPDLQVS